MNTPKNLGAVVVCRISYEFIDHNFGMETFGQGMKRIVKNHREIFAPSRLRVRPEIPA